MSGDSAVEITALVMQAVGIGFLQPNLVMLPWPSDVSWQQYMLLCTLLGDDDGDVDDVDDDDDGLFFGNIRTTYLSNSSFSMSENEPFC